MLRCACVVMVGVCGWALPAFGQAITPNPGPGPQPAPASPEAGPQPVQPTQPAPEPVQPVPQPAQPAPAPAEPAPAPTYAEPPPPAYAEPPPPSGQGAYGAEPPLEDDSERGGGVPDFGVRLDPLNWLLYGRMGLELEVELTEWLTAEAVPVFVTNEEPVLMPDNMRQASNGLGAMSGVSVDLAVWLGGDSFNGTAIRAGYGHYGYRYTSDIGDSLTFTEQQIAVLLASHRTWSWFTIAGAFGLTYETNDQQRCFPDGILATSGCEDGEVLLDTGSERVSINSSIYPYDLTFRFSLGVAIDD